MNSPEPRLLLLYLYIQRRTVGEPFPYVGKAEIVFIAAQRREIFYRIRRNYVYLFPRAHLRQYVLREQLHYLALQLNYGHMLDALRERYA